MAITKSGIITSTGIPNPNLLPHTDILNYGLGYMTTYSSGTIMLDTTELFNGKPTIKINPSSSSTSSGGCNYYNSSVYLTSGKTYTYSCWIKSTAEDTWHHTSLGHFQTYTSSAAHNMTNGTALLSVVPANKWTYVAYSF